MFRLQGGGGTGLKNWVNTQVNQGTGRIPLMYFNKEKAFLGSLPADTIRKPYQCSTSAVKVNHSSMFQYKGCQYSVPPEYVDKIVSLQVYDGYTHVYYNTKFITIHQISSKKLNYISEHYAAIAHKSQNPVLADVFSCLGYMECKGSGFGRIID